MAWAAEQRQDYIAALLKCKGSVTRREIMGQFKIGLATATRDLTLFRELNPNIISYNVTTKRWELTNE